MAESSLKKQVAQGMIWKFSERILAQLVSFCVSVVLARLLLPESYGIIAMVMVFINIANVFVTSGFNTALIQKKNASSLEFSTIFYCSFSVSIIIYFILFLLAPVIAGFYKEELLVPVLRVFGLKIIIASFNSIQHAYVSKNMLFKKYFLSTLLGTVVSGVVGIAMAFNGFGVWALVFQYLCNSLIDTIVLFFTVPWKPRKEFSWTAAKPLLSFGWKTLLSSLIGTIFNNLRALIIGRVYSSEDLAYYNRGKNIPELVINNVVSSITSVLFPAMSTAGGDAKKVKEMTRKSIKTVSYVIFPMLAGIAVVSKPLILIIYTSKWVDSIKYVPLVCISLACHAVTETNLQALNAMGRSDIVLKLEFIKKPVALALIVLTIPFGVYAVIATLPVASAFSMLVNMQPNKKVLDYDFMNQFKDLFPSIILTLTMAVVTYYVGKLFTNIYLTLFIQIIVGVVTYLVASYISKNETFLYILSVIKNRKKKDN